MPSCASEITSLTPRTPRRRSLRKKLVQKSEGPMSIAQHLAPTVGVDADGDDHSVGLQVRPVALERSIIQTLPVGATRPGGSGMPQSEDTGVRGHDSFAG